MAKRNPTFKLDEGGEISIVGKTPKHLPYLRVAYRDGIMFGSMGRKSSLLRLARVIIAAFEREAKDGR